MINSLFRFVFFSSIFLLIYAAAHGQQAKDSLPNKWLLTGYAETYLVLSKGEKNNAKLATFLYNHNRIKTPQINQAFVGADYTGENFRMQIAVQTGTYVTDNYAEEPAALRPLLKCFAGIPLNKEKNSWLEGGIFPSYIGFESTIGFENKTVTRSLLAENSPYYMTGLRLSHPMGKKLSMTWYLLTGWQRIIPQKGNSLPSLGWQWTWRPDNSSTWNWSVFAGSAHPDNQRKWRFFQNLYWQFSRNKWSYTAGIDVGLEQQSPRSSHYNGWWSPVLIASYNWSEQWKTAIRLENYSDPQQIIAYAASGLPVVCNGFSVNVDWIPTPALLCRAEWRALRGSNRIFQHATSTTNEINYLTLSLAYRLNKLL